MRYMCHSTRTHVNTHAARSSLVVLNDRQADRQTSWKPFGTYLIDKLKIAASFTNIFLLLGLSREGWHQHQQQANAGKERQTCTHHRGNVAIRLGESKRNNESWRCANGSGLNASQIVHDFRWWLSQIVGNVNCPVRIEQAHSHTHWHCHTHTHTQTPWEF